MLRVYSFCVLRKIKINGQGQPKETKRASPAVFPKWEAQAHRKNLADSVRAWIVQRRASVLPRRRGRELVYAPRVPVSPALAPLTPDFMRPIPTPVRSDTPTEVTWWKRLLFQERKRHGQVEGILTRHVESLQQSNDDLRMLIVKMTADRLTEKK